MLIDKCNSCEYLDTYTPSEKDEFSGCYMYFHDKKPKSTQSTFFCTKKEYLEQNTYMVNTGILGYYEITPFQVINGQIKKPMEFGCIFYKSKIK